MYGASRSLLALIEQLHKRGHECFVLLPQRGRLTDVLDARSIGYAVTQWRGWMSPERFSWCHRMLSAMKAFVLNLRYVRRAARVCVGFAPDVVHTNTSRTAFGSMLARRLGVPHTWHFREFLGGAFSGGMEFSLGRAVSCAWVRKSSSAVVLVSETLRSQFIRHLYRVPVYVVHNGVMSLDEMKKAAVPLPVSRPFTLALVGRYDSCKQPFVALHAVRRLRDEGLEVKLLMAGDGREDDVREVGAFVAKNRLEAQIEVLGFVHDVSELYARSHVLLMCSRSDAFGRVTAESMAYGRPVLGADSGANPELIKDGFNGFLFRSGDAADLASKIRTLLADPVMLEQMGRNAAETAREKFTNEKYGELMERIFLSVL